MIDEYLPGESIAIRIPVASIVSADADTVTISIRVDTPPIELPRSQITIVRERPADGFPKPGEIWTDQLGALWFVRSNQDGKKPMLIGADHDQHPGTFGRDWLDVNRERGPLRRISTRAETTGTARRDSGDPQ